MKGLVGEKKGTFIVGWHEDGDPKKYESESHDEAARVYWHLDEKGYEPVMGFYGYFIFTPERPA